jgi:quaternary ammonium compound-resistance protein SugE
MAWIYLILAALCEVAWIVILKTNHGFTKLLPSLFALAFVLMGPYCISVAMKEIGMGTGYAVWIGLNSILLVMLGALYFGEALSLAKIVCVALIVLGAIGLKFIEAGVIKV